MEEWIMKRREKIFNLQLTHHSIIPKFRVLLFPFAGIILESGGRGKVTLALRPGHDRRDNSKGIDGYNCSK
jgi:hypothetical protein